MADSADTTTSAGRAADAAAAAAAAPSSGDPSSVASVAEQEASKIEEGTTTTVGTPPAARAPASAARAAPTSPRAAAADSGGAADAGGEPGVGDGEEAKVEETRDPLETNWTTAASDFLDMGLSDGVLRGLYSYGFENPSPTQQLCIVPLVKGRDVVVQAITGTGKTAAYGIGALSRLDMQAEVAAGACQVLVVVPTRELAHGVSSVFHHIGMFLKPQPVVRTLVGGRSIRDDLQALADGVHVVVGTAGRISEAVRRDALSLRSLKLLVMDEADMLFELGWTDQLLALLRATPERCHLGLFSTTITPACEAAVHEFFHEPAVMLAPVETPSLGGKHYYVSVEEEAWKLETLIDLYDTVSAAQCVVYCNTRRKADWVAEKLRDRDFAASAVHGNLAAAEREAALREFRAGASRVIVCTDVLTRQRGVDGAFAGASLLVHYDVPVNPEYYRERWRSLSRATGAAVTFAVPSDARRVREVEECCSVSIEELQAASDLSDLLEATAS